MNVLKPHRKLAILSALLEGCSVRATSRMTGSHIETILKVLLETGQKCQTVFDHHITSTVCGLKRSNWMSYGLSCSRSRVA